MYLLRIVDLSTINVGSAIRAINTKESRFVGQSIIIDSYELDLVTPIRHYFSQ